MQRIEISDPHDCVKYSGGLFLSWPALEKNLPGVVIHSFDHFEQQFADRVDRDSVGKVWEPGG